MQIFILRKMKRKHNGTIICDRHYRNSHTTLKKMKKTHFNNNICAVLLHYVLFRVPFQIFRFILLIV